MPQIINWYFTVMIIYIEWLDDSPVSATGLANVAFIQLHLYYAHTRSFARNFSHNSGFELWRFGLANWEATQLDHRKPPREVGQLDLFIAQAALKTISWLWVRALTILFKDDGPVQIVVFIEGARAFQHKKCNLEMKVFAAIAARSRAAVLLESWWKGWRCVVGGGRCVGRVKVCGTVLEMGQ